MVYFKNYMVELLIFSWIKKILLDREQYYLDTYSPSLNTNKVARSILGYRDTEENKVFFYSYR